jgi:hypothetical protein
MAVTTSALRPGFPNRRRRVRHKIQTPAYASFTAESKGAMLDLHEIVNISEDGVAIQCNSRLETGRRLHLCLDLAECSGPIYTTGQVIWSDAAARAGFSFLELPPASLLRLREWLFLNVMSAAANREEMAPLSLSPDVPPRPNYTDTLAAVTVVQRQVEALGSDLSAALELIAGRAQNLVRATGAAIALATQDADFMECRASSGPDAPPRGARLQVGSGFSGECVKTGKLLRCCDSELDVRVDRESCRALGIRSMLAVPLRVGERAIGILETFSPDPDAFTVSDSEVLQRLAETILAAVNRAVRAENLPPLTPPAPAERFAPSPGSVLFASEPGKESAQKQEKDKDKNEEKKSSSPFSVLRSHLIILIIAAAVVALALGYNLAPWIQTDIAPWLQTKLHARAATHLETVLASSPAPKSPDASVETATIDQLQQMARDGDPAAENALGLLYFQGDDKEGIQQDEKQAFHWFSSAAEHGSLTAQAKLGFLYWGGRGVPKDVNKAYFWTVLARARGDQGNKDLATVLASGMTRSQAAAIEQQADSWLQQHEPHIKPAAGH